MKVGAAGSAEGCLFLPGAAGTAPLPQETAVIAGTAAAPSSNADPSF